MKYDHHNGPNPRHPAGDSKSKLLRLDYICRQAKAAITDWATA